jgi:Leucine-rich repeat (LRR) protein
MINPIATEWDKSYAYMDATDTFVVRLELRDRNSVVPSGIFCLKKLQYLSISDMSFSDGVVPDTLANFRQLHSLNIYNTLITNFTDKLASLFQLSSLNIVGCSLSQLPNLEDMANLQYVNLDNNQLSQVDGLNNVYSLDLSNNLLTEIPTVTSPETVTFLYMNNNPLKHVMTLGLFMNAYYVRLYNTSISFVPPAIDKLQRLYSLDLSFNKLTYLPTNIMKLTNLQYLYLTNNSFSNDMIQTLRSEFNRTLLNATVYM